MADFEAMQDEVHRFAISFFKEKHTKNTFTSSLDNIEGIGKKRKMLLLKNFSSLEEMKEAKIEKFKALGIPVDIANKIKNMN